MPDTPKTSVRVNRRTFDFLIEAHAHGRNIRNALAWQRAVDRLPGNADMTKETVVLPIEMFDALLSSISNEVLFKFPKEERERLKDVWRRRFANRKNGLTRDEVTAFAELALASRNTAVIRAMRFHYLGEDDLSFREKMLLVAG